MQGFCLEIYDLLMYNMAGSGTYHDYSTYRTGCYDGAKRFLSGLVIFWMPVFGLSEL
jgi:hypothetical protein